ENIDDFYKPPYSPAASTLPPVPPSNAPLNPLPANLTQYYKQCYVETAKVLLARGASVYISDKHDTDRFDLANMIENNFSILSYYGNNNIDDGKNHVKTAPHLKNDMAPRESKTPLVLFSLAVMACFCNPCLLTIGKMKDPNVRQAWREKMALVVIILLISSFMRFWHSVWQPSLVEQGDKRNYFDPSNEDKLLGDDSVTEWLRGLLGKDEQERFFTQGDIKRLPNFNSGDVEGTTIGCFANSIMTVEGEHTMHTTLDSLTSTDYSDKHKLLMVIAGGDITGSDNDKTTEICEDLIETFNLSSFESPTPQSYLAVGEDGTPEE
ncbi:9223_t:CDS:2, partial [Funneliformis mosseae]